MGPGWRQAVEGAEEQARREHRGVGEVDLAPLVVLESAEQANREEQSRERRPIGGVLGQPHEQHQPGDDDDGASDTEHSGDHARHEADHAHQHPVHRSSP